MSAPEPLSPAKFPTRMPHGGCMAGSEAAGGSVCMAGSVFMEASGGEAISTSEAESCASSVASWAFSCAMVDFTEPSTRWRRSLLSVTIR